MKRHELIADTEAELDEKIERIKEAYPPQGYGTFVKTRYVNGDGKHVAHVLRGNTAD